MPKEKGIDFIICDHHLPGDEVPHAVAVLDSKQEDCHYPFKSFPVAAWDSNWCRATASATTSRFSQIESLLDLCAVSIASDIVPLTGENRILAHYGLKRLNEKPNKGLHSIIKICGLDKHAITIDDIVFKIGPRINAAGRMRMDEDSDAHSGGHSAVNLMIERDENAAEEFGSVIDMFNSDRKSIDRSVTQEAHEYIESHSEYKNRKSTVIYNPKWMKGSWVLSPRAL